MRRDSRQLWAVMRGTWSGVTVSPFLFPLIVGRSCRVQPTMGIYASHRVFYVFGATTSSLSTA